MTPNVTTTTALAFLDDAIVLAGALDRDDPFTPFTRIFQFSSSRPPHWWTSNIESRVCAVAYFGPSGEDFDDFVVLDEEGEVRYFVKTGPLVERISDAGAKSEGARGYGYLSDLQQIGDRLYAAGFSGQVYRRDGPNQWVHMDQGILQAPGLRRGHYSIQVINGPHEEAIYVAGCTHEDGYPVRASYWNGKVWRDLKLPPAAERITNMYVESETRVWMCGANGTLLLGNAADGFQSLSTVDDNQLFLSVCKFEEKIYLGSNLGLFVYKPYAHDEGIQKVLTHMQPELQDANIVDAVDQVLWSIGPKDIARFDGQRWERIHHPDNPPIGGATPKPARP